jgi:hypothetical protein
MKYFIYSIYFDYILADDGISIDVSVLVSSDEMMIENFSIRLSNMIAVLSYLLKIVIMELVIILRWMDWIRYICYFL